MKLDHMELDELRIRPSGNRPTDNSPGSARASANLPSSKSGMIENNMYLNGSLHNE